MSLPSKGERAGGWMSTQENADVVRSVYERFNAGDLDAAAATAADDFELLDVALGQTFRGPEGFRHWLEPWLAAVPDAHTEVTNLIAAGDWVVTEHTGRGTHSAPLLSPAGEIPPTGRRIELRFAEVFQMREGKIARLRAYWDTATLLRQLGLVQAAGTACP